MPERSNDESFIEASRAPFVEHFAELKTRLLWCCAAFILAAGVSYIYAGSAYSFLIKPLADAMPGDNRRMIYTGLTEAFVVYVKLSLFLGFIISFPFIAFQLYCFLAPGLYKSERAIFIPYLIISPALFLLGAALAYYVAFPVAWKFFLSFESQNQQSIPILMEAKISEYLSLSMQIIIAFGLCFQLPVILTLLARIGLVSSTWLALKRKFAIVIIFIVAAILTPPDVLSQLMLAVPLLLLYEISVYTCRLIEKRNTDA